MIKGGFIIIILWYLFKSLWFGTQETLNEFDPSTRRLVNETTETVAALYDYSAEQARPIWDEATSSAIRLSAEVDHITSQTYSSARSAKLKMQSRIEAARKTFNDVRTSTSLAAEDLQKGAGAAYGKVRNAYRKARQRFP